VKIVVSTYQVLLDALCHGFMLMDSLALIVFDEGLFYAIIALAS
jgi:ERCC4-related helicase